MAMQGKRHSNTIQFVQITLEIPVPLEDNPARFSGPMPFRSPGELPCAEKEMLR